MHRLVRRSESKDSYRLWKLKLPLALGLCLVVRKTPAILKDIRGSSVHAENFAKYHRQTDNCAQHWIRQKLNMTRLRLSIPIIIIQILLHIAITTSLPIPIPQRDNTGIPINGLGTDPDGDFPWLPSEFQTWDPLDKRSLRNPESRLKLTIASRPSLSL